MFQASLIIPVTLGIALFAVAPAYAQSAGTGRTDEAISGTATATIAGEIPSYEKLPSAAEPVLEDRGSDMSLTGINLKPRGAATLVAIAKLEAGQMGLEVLGATPGYYRVWWIQLDTCPASPAPTEMITGEVDEARRTRSSPSFADRGVLIGEVRVGADGRGTFALPLGRRDLPKKVKTIAVLLEEKPGSVNPSSADGDGLVACGALPIPAGDRAG